MAKTHFVVLLVCIHGTVYENHLNSSVQLSRFGLHVSHWVHRHAQLFFLIH